MTSKTTTIYLKLNMARYQIAKGACHPFGSGERTVEMLEGRN